MSLHSHVSALDEIVNRLRSLRSSLDGSLEGLIGPSPSEASNNNTTGPDASGLSGQLQQRIENIIYLVNSCDSLAGMIADQCVNSKLGGSPAKSTGGF